MKKAFNQTVRDIKREVNKNVLKVPRIEQKVLDATSNEAWGPHGTLLAEIAHASRNYHECHIIMGVIWKRVNDTGKNWRHVYKALTVLEYLVANGSERVIDEIKEHSYQLSTLSGFQYIDSSGRDQGTNVRKTSQSLVDLVNDKDRIVEVRQKAAANKDKYRSYPSGMYKPGSYGSRYDDEPYENRYGNGDREYNYRDDARYGRYGDGRENDHYGKDYEDRYSYRDDDYRERSRSVDDYGSRTSRSSDRDKNGVEEDVQSPYRGLERKYSEQNIAAPPTYEEATGEAITSAPSERNGELPATITSDSSSPSVPKASQANEVETFDEFDPRGTASAPVASSRIPSDSPATDFFSSFSDPTPENALAITPVTTSEQETSGSAIPEPLSLSSQVMDDPFGDSPFKAIASPATDFPAHPATEKVNNHSSFSTQIDSNPYSPQDETDILAGILPLTNSVEDSTFQHSSSHFGNGVMAQQDGAQIQNSWTPDMVQQDGPQVQSSTTPYVVQQGGAQIQSSWTPIQPNCNSLMIVPKPTKEKFETKSTVWADTLSKGLVNLNISGPKTNPLADIGVDFDAINRKERRMEKQTISSVASTVTMGKAMGSGSGIGRAGATAMRPSTPRMGMGGNTNLGLGMRGNMNLPSGMNMNQGMGMNMRVNHGLPMQSQSGPVSYGSAYNYNPMMGAGGYGYQQPYR